MMTHKLNDQETLYNDADHFYESLKSEIRRAKKSIYLEFYIFELDIIGISLIKALRLAQSKGIIVELWVDGIGSSKLSRRQVAFIRQLGINIKIYNPLPWNIHHFEKFNFTCFFKSFATLNKRNHRKLSLIDNKILYIGSINMCQMHSRQALGDLSWRDSAIRVTGKGAKIINELTSAGPDIARFKASLFGKTLSPRKASIRLNHTPKLRAYFYKDLVNRINSAKNRIWITTPYFVPDYIILLALEEAAGRGVEVKLLLPRKSDQKYFPLINSLFFRLFTSQKILIFEYLPTILHAKTMIIDDWVMLGSSNFNSRSFKHDLELDYVPQTDLAKSLIIQQFQYDIHQSREVQVHDIIKRYAMPQFMGPFFKLIKYWL